MPRSEKTPLRRNDIVFRPKEFPFIDVNSANISLKVLVCARCLPPFYTSHVLLQVIACRFMLGRRKIRACRACCIIWVVVREATPWQSPLAIPVKAKDLWHSSQRESWFLISLLISCNITASRNAEFMRKDSLTQEQTTSELYRNSRLSLSSNVRVARATWCELPESSMLQVDVTNP